MIDGWVGWIIGGCLEGRRRRNRCGLGREALAEESFELSTAWLDLNMFSLERASHTSFSFDYCVFPEHKLLNRGDRSRMDMDTKTWIIEK